jgi:hypothetical protein
MQVYLEDNEMLINCEGTGWDQKKYSLMDRNIKSGFLYSMKLK